MCVSTAGGTGPPRVPGGPPAAPTTSRRRACSCASWSRRRHATAPWQPTPFLRHGKQLRLPRAWGCRPYAARLNRALRSRGTDTLARGWCRVPLIGWRVPLGCPLLGTLLRHQAAVVGLGLVLGHCLSDVDHDVLLYVGEPACQLGSGVFPISTLRCVTQAGVARVGVCAWHRRGSLSSHSSSSSSTRRRLASRSITVCSAPFAREVRGPPATLDDVDKLLGALLSQRETPSLI